MLLYWEMSPPDRTTAGRVEAAEWLGEQPAELWAEPGEIAKGVHGSEAQKQVRVRGMDGMKKAAGTGE